MRPLGNRLLIEPIQLTGMTAGGLHLPGTADAYEYARGRNAPTDGIVVSVGSGVKDDQLVPMQRVLVDRYRSQPVEVQGRKLWLVAEDDVRAIITEDTL